VRFGAGLLVWRIRLVTGLLKLSRPRMGRSQDYEFGKFLPVAVCALRHDSGSSLTRFREQTSTESFSPRVNVVMDGERDPQLELIAKRNRQALDNLRSLTEDLEALVLYEKRLMDDLANPSHFAEHAKKAKP
jgi:hypothetical protein